MNSQDFHAGACQFGTLKTMSGWKEDYLLKVLSGLSLASI
jgi:hypothetical protein